MFLQVGMLKEKVRPFKGEDLARICKEYEHRVEPPTRYGEVSKEEDESGYRYGGE